jgi:hypothetical protein
MEREDPWDENDGEELEAEIRWPTTFRCGPESTRKRRSPVRAALESESDLAPSSPSAALLSDLRARVAEAVAASAPEQIKELLAAVVSRIVVESRASIQPYFVAPAVRTLLPSRRRTGIEPA